MTSLLGGVLDWNAGAFHTLNRDDILFISGGNLVGAGFFSNVGTTRRLGVEIGMVGDFGRLRVTSNYSYIEATFRDSFRVNSPNHPEADANGQIPVNQGDRIPGIPKHLFKLSTDFDVYSMWTVGLDALFNGSQVFRGDEGNLADKLGSYWLFNVRTELQINSHFTIFAKIDNILDRRYKTFGLFGEADEVLGDNFQDPKFVGVGAPRAGWLGVKLTL